MLGKSLVWWLQGSLGNRHKPHKQKALSSAPGAPMCLGSGGGEEKRERKRSDAKHEERK